MLEATGVPIEWDVQHAGVDVMEKLGTPLPDGVIESIRRNKERWSGRERLLFRQAQDASR